MYIIFLQICFINHSISSKIKITRYLMSKLLLFSAISSVYSANPNIFKRYSFGIITHPNSHNEELYVASLNCLVLLVWFVLLICRHMVVLLVVLFCLYIVIWLVPYVRFRYMHQCSIQN